MHEEKVLLADPSNTQCEVVDLDDVNIRTKVHISAEESFNILHERNNEIFCDHKVPP